MTNTRGRRAARAAIMEAEPERLPAAPNGGAWRGTEVPGFVMQTEGLFRLPRDEKKLPFQVSGRFEVLARTRDTEGEAHGLLLHWRDPDGVEHEWVMPRAMLVGEGAELRARLASGGLLLSSYPQARSALVDFLTYQQPTERVRTVPRVGWYFGREGGAVFILPSEVFGAVPGERVVLDLPERPPAVYRRVGKLKDWRATVAARCAGNARLVLAVSLAFAGSLLTPLGEEGGGLQLRGGSRLGKSTALKAAASVWGAPDGPDAFKRSWRATGNGIEGLASQHNDGLLPLDELGEIDPREAGTTAYMLGNGTGKARAHRTGTTRPVATWRLLFLSTGEETLADILQRAGHTIRAGQEVRFIDLPADAGKGLGIFDTIHTDKEIGAATPAEYAEALTGAAMAQHGTAGPAFLAWLTARLAKDPAWPGRDLLPRIRDFIDDAMPSGASGQVRTVCRRFALVALAGELASEAGVTGWQAGMATEAVRQCFEAWCAARGSVEAREDLSAIDQVRACLALHGNSRFELLKDRPASDADQTGMGATDPPPEGRIVMNRLGFKKWERDAALPDGGRFWFLFFASGWREATAGLDPIEAARVLESRGFLRAGPNHLSRSVKAPGFPDGVRVYWVSAGILGDEAPAPPG